MPIGTPADGTGLTGEYYPSNDFTNLVDIQTDPAINFNWGMRGPAGLSVNGFSLRWTGFVQPWLSETYTFCSPKNDMVRLWVNG